MINTKIQTVARQRLKDSYHPTNGNQQPAVAVPASSSGDVETSMEVTTNER